MRHFTLIFLAACAQPKAIASSVEVESAVAAAQVAVADLQAPAIVAAGAAIDEGISVVFVRLDELAAFGERSAVEPLLHDAATRVFIVGEEQRIAMRRDKDGVWQNASIDRRGAELREAKDALRSLGDGELSIVRIPALHLELVAHRQGEKLSFAPTRDVGEMKKGEIVDAARAFAALAPLAREKLADDAME